MALTSHERRVDRNRPQLDATAQALREDEAAYFEAAARNEPLLGGTLSNVAGFPSLPLAWVLHGLDRLPEGSDWIARVEERFRALRARGVRFYCHAPDAGHRRLPAAGYRPSLEIGFAGPAQHAHTSSVELVACNSERRWRAYAEMARATDMTPDGHAAKNDDYYRVSRLKAEAGYMMPFIARHANSVVGFINLSIRGQYARLKNLLVHPQFRGRGIGTAMAMALGSEAARRGASTILTYGIAGSPSVALYSGLGMVEITRQVEWSKPLD